MRQVALIVCGIMLIVAGIVGCVVFRDLSVVDVKVGIIDTVLNVDSFNKYEIKAAHCLSTNDSQNHGDMVVDIFRSQDKHSELYYACAMDGNGHGELQSVVEALEWMDRQDVKLVCMSLTTLKDDPCLENAIQKLVEKGVVVVAACLNYSDIPTFPASYEGVISVANCYSEYATISITDKSTKDMLLSGRWKDCSTSSLTALVAGKISNQLSDLQYDEQLLIKTYNCKNDDYQRSVNKT